MAQSPLSTLNLSKQRLTELQDTLVEKGKQLEERSSLAAGKLWDLSRTRLFEAGASTLSTAAELLDKVPAARESAEQLREHAKAAEQAKEAVALPAIDNYDDLNVKEVNAALEGLSGWELEKVRSYEEAHKNRVTILREVERLLD